MKETWLRRSLPSLPKSLAKRKGAYSWFTLKNVFPASMTRFRGLPLSARGVSSGGQSLPTYINSKSGEGKGLGERIHGAGKEVV